MLGRITAPRRTVALLAILGIVAPARAADPTPAATRLADAHRALAEDRSAAAIATLEIALAQAKSAPPVDRAAILGLLGQAYEAAARQADATGHPREAEAYREDGRIIARRVGSTPAGSTPVATARPAPATTAPNPVATAPTLPAPAPEPNPEASVAIEPAPAPGPEPMPEPLAPAPGPAPAPSPGSGPTPSMAPAPLPIPAPPEPTGPGLDEADAAFRAKRYAEAGRIYGALAEVDQLPIERREHWAYCRSAAVARRIDARPRTEAEWSAIDGEIDQIRALAPDNWLGEYLRNMAASARLTARRPVKAGGTVIRAASPEEPRPPAAPTSASGPSPILNINPAPVLNARPAPASAPTASPAPTAAIESPAPPTEAPATTIPSERARLPVAPIGRWQVRESANFRVFHLNPRLAEQVVQVAEATRRDQVRRWTGKAPVAPWQPKCEVYLFPTAAQYAQVTGQPLDSPGFSTMGMNQGEVIGRRVSLRTDHEGMIEAVLPHEITHVILADLFPEQQIPRWADEGIAVLTEPEAEQKRRAADLVEPLRQNLLFEIDKLMAMDYPDNAYWSLYYAQSVSLTRFLVDQGTPAQFIQFLQGAQKRGFDAELRRTYKIDGAGDLQARWVAYARTGARNAGPRTDAPTDPAAATASTTPKPGKRSR